ERLDVVHDSRLSEQSYLDRERRLVARLAPVPLDRLEESRLLAADIRAGADAELDVEGEAGAHDVAAEQSSRARVRERVLQALVRERILGAHVDVAALAAGRVRGDRHRLEECERVALHEHAVLERAGLGLVGVAHQEMRVGRLMRDGLPLDARRERGTAAAEQARLYDFAQHARRTELDGPPQRGIAAVRPVRVERFRVHSRTDAPEEPEARLAGLRERRSGL